MRRRSFECILTQIVLHVALTRNGRVTAVIKRHLINWCPSFMSQPGGFAIVGMMVQFNEPGSLFAAEMDGSVLQYNSDYT